MSCGRAAAGALAGALLLSGCGSTIAGTAAPAPGAVVSTAPSLPSGPPQSIPTIPTSEPDTSGPSGSAGGTCAGLSTDDVAQALGVSGVQRIGTPNRGGQTFDSCGYVSGSSPLLTISVVRITSANPQAAQQFVQGATKGKRTEPLDGVGDAARFLSGSGTDGAGVVAATYRGGKVIGAVLLSLRPKTDKTKPGLSTLAGKVINAG